MLKKIFISFFAVCCITCMTKVNLNAEKGITRTGHSEIYEFDWKDTEAGYLLLNQMSTSYINNMYKKVGKKAFGWVSYNINNDVPGWYISDVIFSKTNVTNQSINFKYSTKYAKTEDFNYSVSGTLTGKVSGKTKVLTLGLDATIKADIESNTKKYYEENSQFSFDLDPMTKISLFVKGDCNVFTGVSKKYFLGIPVKKGTWEIIDIETEYYELCEEKL